MQTTVSLSNTLDIEWTRMQPVRVGRVPSTLCTPCLYVRVTARDRPVLRVDVYPTDTECFVFQDAVIWSDCVVVGYGAHVHLISLTDRSVTSIETSPYFGGLYPTRDYLLVASGELLIRMEPDRSVRWISAPLGIDGVIVRDPGPGLVHGEGEWDPPGDWRPFVLNSDDGKVIS